MARKLALGVSVLILGLLLWIRSGKQAVPSPVAAPGAPAAVEAQPLESAEIEKAREPLREAPAAQVVGSEPAQAAHLVVLCRVRGSGEPVPGRAVLLSPEGPRPSKLGGGKESKGPLGTPLVSGADGRADFEVPAGIETHLWIAATVLQPQITDGTIQALAPGERREIVFEEDKGVRFYGRVVLRGRGEPIAGASVKGDGPETTTDADGRFDLQVPERGNLATVSAEGFGETRVALLRGHEKPEDALVIELERGCTVVGVLGDARANAPGAKLRFEVSCDVSQLRYRDSVETGVHVGERGPHSWKTDFDDGGRARIARLPARIALKAAVYEGSTRVLVLPDELLLSPGEIREVKVDPLGGCELAGCVRDDADQPVAGVRLWLMRAGASAPVMFRAEDEQQCSTTVKTGEDGRFRVPGVASGSWLLGPGCVRRAYGEAMAADAVAPAPTRIEIPTGTHALDVVLRVHRALSIRGRVLDEKDEPVRGTVTMILPSTLLFAQCDASGAFEFGPLAPGTYSLRAGSTGELVDSAPVEVDAGTQGLVLRVGHGGSVAGAVVDSETGTGVGARLTLSRPGQGLEGILMTSARADGSFEISGLKPGTYAIAASMPDGRIAQLPRIEVAARARVDGLQLWLRPGARLSVRYDGRRAAGNLQVLQAGAIVACDGIESRTTAHFAAPTGSVRLVFTLAGNDQTRDLTLAAGEELDVVFEDQD
jgi:hypothetical protein